MGRREKLSSLRWYTINYDPKGFIVPATGLVLICIFLENMECNLSPPAVQGILAVKLFYGRN